jgi:transcriptional regulator with XRE-family HTH domain
MKVYRRRLGLSQAKLAEKLDTASNYIAVIETGKKFPSTSMLERIAAALEVDTPELFSMKPIQFSSIIKIDAFISFAVPAIPPYSPVLGVSVTAAAGGRGERGDGIGGV